MVVTFLTTMVLILMTMVMILMTMVIRCGLRCGLRCDLLRKNSIDNQCVMCQVWDVRVDVVLTMLFGDTKIISESFGGSEIILYLCR